jgi:hypothetical protein
MRNTRIAICIGLCCTGLGMPALHAQETVLVDIAPCMALGSSAEKHACYDRLEASARATRSSANAPPQPAATPASAATPTARTLPTLPAAPTSQPAAAVPPSAPAQEQSVASFGTSTPSSARVLTSLDGQQELHDSITDLQEREPGRYLITLASGQVWYQSNSQRFRLRKGMDVRIYPSPLGGSYRMARDDGEETGFVQVERLK